VNDGWVVPVASLAKSAPEDIADQIIKTMGQGVLPRRQIYEKFISDTPYLQSDINKALTLLKKQRKANYTGRPVFDQQIEFANCPLIAG